MSKLTDELNQLSHGSLEMAKEIGRVLKKKNFIHQDLDFIQSVNICIKKAQVYLNLVSRET